MEIGNLIFDNLKTLNSSSSGSPIMLYFFRIMLMLALPCSVIIGYILSINMDVTMALPITIGPIAFIILAASWPISARLNTDSNSVSPKSEHPEHSVACFEAKRLVNLRSQAILDLTLNVQIYQFSGIILLFYSGIFYAIVKLMSLDSDFFKGSIVAIMVFIIYSFIGYLFLYFATLSILRWSILNSADAYLKKSNN